MSTKGGKTSKLKWHPAFVQALRQELFDYRDSLEFKCEYQLTSEPLRIDLVIVKKPRETLIKSNRGFNQCTLMWFFAVFRRKTRKTIGQR